MQVYFPSKGCAWNPVQKYPRNEKCPCNSGKKFKKCCMEKIAPCIKTEIANQMKGKTKEVQFFIYMQHANLGV